MKTQWFKRLGWFYLPISLPGMRHHPGSAGILRPGVLGHRPAVALGERHALRHLPIFCLRVPAAGLGGVADKQQSRPAMRLIMNHSKWIKHFTRNRQNRPEPDWAAPVEIPPAMLAPMLRSIEQFRLGDGGGPASLIAHDAEQFRGRTRELRTIVDLWFAEEAEHARLLGCAVRRFGGRIYYVTLELHRVLSLPARAGRAFELQVLTLTELVSTAYYRLLRNHSPDGPLAAMCELILRDEAGHVAFHRDRLADAGCPEPRVARGAVADAIPVLRLCRGNDALGEPCAGPESHRRRARRILFGSDAAIDAFHPFLAERWKSRQRIPALWAKPATAQLQPAK